MEKVSKHVPFLTLACAVLVLFVAVVVLAQTGDTNESDDSEDSCEWKFVGNHTSTDAKGHFWNECTGELYYVVGTDVQQANVNQD